MTSQAQLSAVWERRWLEGCSGFVQCGVYSGGWVLCGAQYVRTAIQMG